ncbi:uncharacterized protein LOC119683161 [Teleopsis dalmanni]|uniref:uncharacterized protein LOC119683161 n=1 Tax=Teleopsis dalmanni TaxID=139649 RepID=UPI0018CD7616|nr:uncharacterized protein LOC119683161 [Teleopsis dalmanni]
MQNVGKLINKIASSAIQRRLSCITSKFASTNDKMVVGDSKDSMQNEIHKLNDGDNDDLPTIIDIEVDPSFYEELGLAIPPHSSNVINTANIPEVGTTQSDDIASPNKLQRRGNRGYIKIYPNTVDADQWSMYRTDNEEE